MPYVRKNGVWPVGEDWLYQVMSETYIPLLGMLSELEHEGLGPCLALTLTPVLCEQLADGYIQEKFVSYLKTMIGHTSDDIRDFEYFEDEPRKALAVGYSKDFRRKLMAFTSIGGDILGAIASFEDSGTIETLASCATHAFLPGLPDERSVREQVLLGIESHEKHLGRRPKGFWIPECAYRRGVEELLESEGIEYFVVDSSALGGRVGGRPYTVGSSGVVALARSDRAHADAWDEDSGYPTDGAYVDSTKYYHGSGLHYWRVTGQEVDIERKEVYVPDAARARALDHARHFLSGLSADMGEARRAARAADDGGTFGADPPLVLACYDTEFFGHGWKEGFYWLELTLRSLGGFESMGISLPSSFLSTFRERAAVDLEETTWGTGRDHGTWLNAETEWMWDELACVEGRLEGAARSQGSSRTGALSRRVLLQAAREALLLESSDWPYMVAKDRASDYAIERFRCHMKRFNLLLGALEDTGVESIETDLGEIEDADNVFAELDLRVVFGDGGHEGTEGR